jgi:hypothetical protein
MKKLVKLKIAVNKIDKERLYRGQNTYLDAEVWLDEDQEDQYGNHGMITQEVSREERDRGVKGAILGNAKVVWREDRQSKPSQGPTPQPQATKDEDDDIPF